LNTYKLRCKIVNSITSIARSPLEYVTFDADFIYLYIELLKYVFLIVSSAYTKDQCVL